MKKHANSNENFFERYTFKSKLLTILLTIVSIVFLVLSIVYTNNFSINASLNLDSGAQSETMIAYKAWSIVKDVLTVVTSVLGVNLLLSVCIERKNKDSAFEEFFVNDILSSSSFYDHLSKAEREKVLHSLEANLYFENSEIKKKMFSSIVNKLNENDEKYIYNDCKFDINCEFKDKYIEKTIIKTITIKAMGNITKMKNFPLLNVSCAKDDNLNTVELVYVKLNGAILNIQKDIKIADDSNDNNIETKLGYNKIQHLILKKKLLFENESSCNRIEIKYITRVPLNDLSYICRMSNPCKKFSLNFELKNSADYKVNAYAFGFIDDGKDSPNHDDKNKVKIDFNDWIFPSDGVAISLSKIEKLTN